jgi:hypothetical protein
LFNRRTDAFFHFTERLYLRIPAAVGLLCGGFWRRVGVSTVFCEVVFFFFFQHLISLFFCPHLIWLFCRSLVVLPPSVFGLILAVFCFKSRPKLRQINLNVYQLSSVTLLKSVSSVNCLLSILANFSCFFALNIARNCVKLA